MATIDVLANMGLDALSNHFAVSLPMVLPLGTVSGNLSMRVLTIDVPERTISTYEITKRGRTFSRPSGLSEQGREVSFTFRNDKYLTCYKSILNWMDFIQNHTTMNIASDSGPLGNGGPSTFRYDFEIWALTSLDSEIPHSIWTVQGAYPTSLDGVSFDESSGDPIETSVTFDCMNIVYPSNV